MWQSNFFFENKQLISIRSGYNLILLMYSTKKMKGKYKFEFMAFRTQIFIDRSNENKSFIKRKNPNSFECGCLGTKKL